MKIPQGLLQVKTLDSHLFPGKSKYFLESYNNAVENQHYGYIIINIKPNLEQNYKLINKIFPCEKK